MADTTTSITADELEARLDAARVALVAARAAVAALASGFHLAGDKRTAEALRSQSCMALDRLATDDRWHGGLMDACSSLDALLADGVI